MAFSANGEQFVTGGGKGPPGDEKGEARVYQTDAAAVAPPWIVASGTDKQFQKPILSASFCPKGETLLLGDADWEATFWDVATQKIVASADCAHGSIRAVAFTADGKEALTAADDSGVAQLFNAAALRSAWRSVSGKGFTIERAAAPAVSYSTVRHPRAVLGAAFSPGDRRFLTASSDGYVRVWRKAPGPSLTVLPHHPKGNDGDQECVVSRVDFHLKGPTVATAGKDRTVQLWNLSGGRAGEKTILAHRTPVRCVTFTPDGKWVLTGAEDGVILVWDRETHRVVRNLPHHAAVVSDLTVSHDGKLLLAAGEGRAQRWNAETFEKVGDALRHSEGKNVATAISPDKQRLLTAGEDRTAKLWDQNGKLIKTLHHDNEVRGSQFSPDGSRVATSSDDQTVRIWNAISGDLEATLTHHEVVHSVAFTPDGKRVITGGREGAQIWDIKLRRRVGPAWRHAEEIMHVVLSPDGNSAVFADWGGYGLVWKLPQPLTEEDPARLRDIVQRPVGMKLDEGSGLKVLRGEDWLGLNGRLRTGADSAPE